MLPPQQSLSIINHTWERANFCDRTLKGSFGSLEGHYTNTVVLARMSVSNDSWGPLERSRVVILHQEQVSRLQIGGCSLPALTLL